MRSSPLSLAAESVFQYDLQQELDIDLKRLRKKACDDGDIVFITPDQTSIWAHIPLFYIAANNQLPTAFGTEAGTAINDRGVIVKMLFVLEERKPEFEEVMDNCYTIENLSLLWRAIGGDEVRFGLDRERQHMEMDTSRVKSILPASMLPDFEIHLRETGRELINEPSSFSLKVHRFLLDARITYFKLKTSAGLRLKDPTPMVSNLSRMVFTEFSLWSIAMYVYCGVPSIIFSLDPNLSDYIAEPAIGDSRLKRNSHCSGFRTEKRLPAEGIEYGLLEIARAANFLLTPELDNWAHFQLYRLAHRFQCTGSGCAEIIPYIIDAIHCNDITDEWLFNSGISWLARYENIHHLWKWSLLHKLKVIPLLIEKIIETDLEDSLDDENIFRRGENAVELFVRLWKLKQYTSMTKDSERWDKELIGPLMDHATGVVVEDLNNYITFNRLDSLLNGLSFSKLAGEDLLARVINKACTKGVLMQDCSAVEKLLELCEKHRTANPTEGQRVEIPIAGVEESPSPTEGISVFQEGGAPAEVNYLWKDPQPEGKEDLAENQTPSSNPLGGVYGGGGKKPVDTRLKGSATPFVPGKRVMPLGTLSNSENIQSSNSESAQLLVDAKGSHPKKQNHLQENHSRFESQDARYWSRPDISSRETVVQAKQQGFEIRRVISTPTIQIDEPNKTRVKIHSNQNRCYTHPTAGEVVPIY